MIARIAKSFWTVLMSCAEAMAESRRQRAKLFNNGYHWY